MNKLGEALLAVNAADNAWKRLQDVRQPNNVRLLAQEALTDRLQEAIALLAKLIEEGEK